MTSTRSTHALLRAADKADTSGGELLRAGLAVGAIGVVGVVLGAEWPICAFGTPALLGLGAVQKLRGRWLAWRAKQNSHAAKAAQPTKEAP